MPHLTFEYTHNLDVEVGPLLDRLHQALVETGAVNLKGLKSRAVRLDQWRIADGHDGYAFAHLTILLKEGRSEAVQQEVAQRAMEVLEDALGPRRETGYLSLSVDVREMREGASLTHHNIPAAGVTARDGAT